MAADAAHAPDQQLKAKVFISYSRRDFAFADRLDAALKVRSFEPLIDRTEIYAFEDWWQRIQTLIGQADTIVFVLSPDAVTSDVALKEVGHGAALNKRFAPIVARRVEDERVPAPLRRLNFIFFDDPERFEASADQLAEALQIDIGWIRQHTVFGEAARRWAAAGRSNGFLLRSPALEEAERWIASRPHSAPAPTEEMRSFIAESRNGATRRRNILTASLTAGLLVALVLAGLAYWQRAVAIAQRDLAESRRLGILAELVTSERLNGNLDSAMRLGVHAVRLALDLRPVDAERSTPRTALATTLWQSGLHLTLSGHRDVVWFAAFSPDGKRVVTSSSDKTARIWDADNGRGLLVLEGHEAEVQAASFSPDGSRIVTASWDKTARIWDAASGKQLMVLSLDDFVSFAAFSADGKRIVTTSGNAAGIWDAATGTRIVELVGHDSDVEMANFNNSGTQVVTASRDGTARVWDAMTGKQLSVFSSHEAGVTSAAFSADGSRVVSASSDGTVRIWDAATAKELLVMPKQQQWTAAASFSPAGTKVLAAVGDGTARIWDAATGEETAVLRGHEDAVQSASFAPDGAHVATASRDMTARVWQLANLSVPLLRGPARSGEFSPDGTRIVTATARGPAIISDADTGAQNLTVGGTDSNVWSATFSPDGERLLTISRNSPAVIWDARSGKQLLAIGDVGMTDAGYSQDGARVVTSANDGTVRIWDAITGKEIKALPKQGDYTVASLNPDGTLAAIASGTTASIWNVASGVRVVTLPAHEFGINSVMFSGDGAVVLVASSDRTARISDAATGNLVLTLRGHTNDVEDAAFNADGTRIVTASKDETVRIWDAATGAQIAILRGHDGWVNSAAFNFDASRIITTGADDTTRVWDIRFATMSTHDLVAEVCERRLHGITTLSQNEMRIAGYPVGAAPIDVCAGIRVILRLLPSNGDALPHYGIAC